METFSREWLLPQFETKAAMMRFRKQLLATAAEQADEEARIKATFAPREPFNSDGDFLAAAIQFITGGTAIRRKMKREAAYRRRYGIRTTERPDGGMAA